MILLRGLKQGRVLGLRIRAPDRRHCTESRRSVGADGAFPFLMRLHGRPGNLGQT